MVSGIETERTPSVSRIQSWAQRIDHAVAELMPLHSPIGDITCIYHHKRAVMSLSTACLGMTGDVIHLVHELRLWGAELVMRSVVEGTVKFGHILESSDTFTARCTEYGETLPTIARRRRHSKAKEALEALSKVDSPKSPSFQDLLLNAQELAEIDAAFPKEVRIRLEKRWGFGALVDSVSKPKGAFGPTARALLHGYSIASDLQHMTYEGVDLPLERDQRAKDGREAIELAHAAKLLADSFHLTWLRVGILLRFCGRPTAELIAVRERHSSLLRELSQAELDWEALEYRPSTDGAMTGAA